MESRWIGVRHKEMQNVRVRQCLSKEQAVASKAIYWDESGGTRATPNGSTGSEDGGDGKTGKRGGQKRINRGRLL